MKKILTMCSTRNRPARLLEMLASWKKKTMCSGSVIKVYVSQADPQVLAYREIAEKLNDNRLNIEFGPEKTMVQVLNDYCRAFFDFDYYSEVNDDHVFVTSGWDILMSDAVDKKNNGFSVCYGFTQLFPTATMHGRKLIRALGYFFPPEYGHICVDLWLMKIGNGADLFTHLPAVVIDHKHPVFRKALQDKVYEEGCYEVQGATRIFEEWVNSGKMDHDISRMVSIVKSQGATIPKINEPISVMMTVYDRTSLLKDTIDSYLASSVRPQKLYIFDDMGPDHEAVKKECARIPEAAYILNNRNYGSDHNIMQGMRRLFDAGAQHVLALDSDCLFAPEWYKKATALVETINMDMAILCLFNARVHPCSPTSHHGLVRKKYIGGLGVLLSRRVWEKYVLPIESDKARHPGWDGRVSVTAAADGLDILACSPSYLQHTGGKVGAHSKVDPIECIADDFIGVQP